MSEINSNPERIRWGLLQQQYCVPSAWTDADVLAFAEATEPAGTSGGWFIKTDYSDGSPARCPCEERDGFVHVCVVA